MVSLCLDEDRLLLLAPAPTVPPFDSKVGFYTLYEGSLATLSDFLMLR